MAETVMDLKRKMLALLKEDEEFRYAVIGLLGIEDLRSGQVRLENGLAKLEEAQARLQGAIEKLTESHNKLAERHYSLEKAVEKLTEAQMRTENALQELFKQVGKLSETIGFGLEDIARVVVPAWLYKHEKIEVEEFTRKFIIIDGEEIEINLYGEGRREGAKIIILGEVKSRIYLNDVENFSKIVEKIRKKIEGNTYELMFGYYIHPSAEEEAKKKKISLIASYMR
jgi:vacuolar-type H+-ATPase subunit D/Vma8